MKAKPVIINGSCLCKSHLCLQSCKARVVIFVCIVQQHAVIVWLACHKPSVASDMTNALWPISIMCCCLGAKDPKALENLVNSMNVKTESVNRDLTSYKGILSKLSAAKELMAEMMAREKRKQGDRYGLRISVHVYAMYPEGLG